MFPSAVQGEENRSPSVSGFRLEASNGYEFLAFAEEPPTEGEEGWIGLFLIGDNRHSVVTYAAPATVTQASIDADMGNTQLVKAERYEGTIEFHGEEKFAEVNATSAPLVYPPPCGIPEGGEPAGKKTLPGASLHVEKDRIEKYRFELNAIQRRPGARTAVGAEIEEHRGEMEIHRAIGIWAGADALRYDRRLHAATINPPSPFSGRGSFHVSASGRGLWSGSLTSISRATQMCR